MNFKELQVWQKGMELVNFIYEITGKFPKSEMYILASQMQRAAISIPSNIAEGHRRNHRQEYVQFLGIALGSAAELETQILISKQQYKNLDYIKAETLVGELQAMLYSMIVKLKA
jgi:four helix bundle protein